MVEKTLEVQMNEFQERIAQGIEKMMCQCDKQEDVCKMENAIYKECAEYVRSAQHGY